MRSQPGIRLPRWKRLPPCASKAWTCGRLCMELAGHYRNLMLCALPGGTALLTGTSPEEEAAYQSASGFPAGQMPSAPSTPSVPRWKNEPRHRPAHRTGAGCFLFDAAMAAPLKPPPQLVVQQVAAAAVHFSSRVGTCTAVAPPVCSLPSPRFAVGRTCRCRRTRNFAAGAAADSAPTPAPAAPVATQPAARKRKPPLKRRARWSRSFGFWPMYWPIWKRPMPC